MENASQIENWILYHWCEELNLRAEELKEIIKKVGPNIEAIREDLGKKLILSRSGF